MNANDYQTSAARTLITEPDREIPQEDLLCIIGETKLAERHANIVEYLKKGICHQHGVDNKRLAELIQLAEFGKNEYEYTSRIPQSRVMPLWCLAGLVGEMGEVAGLILAYMATGTIDNDRLADEVGDLLWYCAGILTLFGINLADVMQGNIDKLKKRYPDGWNSKDSHH